MDLTDEQKATVSAWIAEGADLNAIQERLKEELGITITYLETRFLIADLGLAIQEPEEPEEEEESDDDDAVIDADAEMLDGPGGGGVNVSVDSIAIPGTVVSGKVTFSDGKRAGWYLDQMGSLGLDAEDPGYRPSQEDVVAFQRELQRLLR